MKSRDQNGGVRPQPGEERGGQNEQDQSKEGRWKKENEGKSE